MTIHRLALAILMAVAPGLAQSQDASKKPGTPATKAARPSAKGTQQNAAMLVAQLPEPQRRDKAAERLVLLGTDAIAPLLTAVREWPAAETRHALAVLRRMRTHAERSTAQLLEAGARLPAKDWLELLRTFADLVLYVEPKRLNFDAAAMNRHLWSKVPSASPRIRLALINEALRLGARHSLPRKCRAAVDRAVAELKNRRAHHREAAADLLGSWGAKSKDAIPALLAALDAKHPKADGWELAQVTKLELGKNKLPTNLGQPKPVVPYQRIIRTSIARALVAIAPDDPRTAKAHEFLRRASKAPIRRGKER